MKNIIFIFVALGIFGLSAYSVWSYLNSNTSDKARFKTRLSDSLQAKTSFVELILKPVHSVLGVKIEASITPSIVPSETPTPSLTPTPTSTSTPTPTLTPSPTPIPQPEFSSEQINSFIDRFAGQYAIDPHVLRHVAVCESGFNSNALNGIYAGLYQFNASTWKSNRAQMREEVSPDLRFNAEEAVQTAAYLISKGKLYLWPNCRP